jgi:glycosyltransferase involved in cell wall biosynthesis
MKARPGSPRIAVYLITFKRHDMLRRSLRSALAQTHRNLVVRVVNDDPSDAGVQAILAEAGDPRALMFTPIAKRGATQSSRARLSIRPIRVRTPSGEGQ